MTREQERQFTRTMLVLAAMAFAAVYVAVVANRGTPEEALLKGAAGAIGLGVLGRVAVRLIGSAKPEDRAAEPDAERLGTKLDARVGDDAWAPEAAQVKRGETPVPASAGRG